jgi:hypothetical protein
MVKFEELSWHLPTRRQSKKASVMKNGLRTKTLTWDLLNTKQVC